MSDDLTRDESHDWIALVHLMNRSELCAPCETCPSKSAVGLAAMTSSSVFPWDTPAPPPCHAPPGSGRVRQSAHCGPSNPGFGQCDQGTLAHGHVLDDQGRRCRDLDEHRQRAAHRAERKHYVHVRQTRHLPLHVFHLSADDRDRCSRVAIACDRSRHRVREGSRQRSLHHLLAWRRRSGGSGRLPADPLQAHVATRRSIGSSFG
jgi:hypothetical protein